MGNPPEPVIEETMVPTRLKEWGLDHWFLENGWIRRKLNTDGWPTTLMLFNSIGFVC